MTGETLFPSLVFRGGSHGESQPLQYASKESGSWQVQTVYNVQTDYGGGSTTLDAIDSPIARAGPYIRAGRQVSYDGGLSWLHPTASGGWWHTSPTNYGVRQTTVVNGRQYTAGTNKHWYKKAGLSYSHGLSTGTLRGYRYFLDTKNRLHLVWKSTTATTTMYYSRSDDFGQTWKPAVALIYPVIGPNAVGICCHDDVVVALHFNTGPSYRIEWYYWWNMYFITKVYRRHACWYESPIAWRVSLDGGDTWGPTQIETIPSDGAPRIETAINRHAYGAWGANDETDGSAYLGGEPQMNLQPYVFFSYHRGALAACCYCSLNRVEVPERTEVYGLPEPDHPLHRPIVGAGPGIIALDNVSSGGSVHWDVDSLIDVNGVYTRLPAEVAFAYDPWTLKWWAFARYAEYREDWDGYLINIRTLSTDPWYEIGSSELGGLKNLYNSVLVGGTALRSREIQPTTSTINFSASTAEACVNHPLVLPKRGRSFWW